MPGGGEACGARYGGPGLCPARCLSGWERVVPSPPRAAPAALGRPSDAPPGRRFSGGERLFSLPVEDGGTAGPEKPRPPCVVGRDPRRPWGAGRGGGSGAVVGFAESPGDRRGRRSAFEFLSSQMLKSRTDEALSDLLSLSLL